MGKSDSADICSLFFTKVSENGMDQLFKCNCGTLRKQKKSSGFSNLMSHLKEKHEDWEELYNAFKKSNPKAKKVPQGHVFFVNPKAVLLHTWMNLVVSSNFPLSVVENPILRDIVRCDSISEDTLSKYLKLVDAQIDKKLQAEFPKKFGIVIESCL